MSWTVVLTASARRDPRRLDRPVATRTLDALARLADTGQGDITRLQGTPEAWRLRAGDWRARLRHGHITRPLEGPRILPRGQAYRWGETAPDVMRPVEPRHGDPGMADHIPPFPLPHRGDPDPRRLALASIGFRWRAGLWRRGRVALSDADIEAMDARTWAHCLRRWTTRRPRPRR